MKKSHRLVSILAIVFGLLSAIFGFSLVAATDLPFWQKCLCNLVFVSPLIPIGRLVGLLAKKDR